MAIYYALYIRSNRFEQIVVDSLVSNIGSDLRSRKFVTMELILGTEKNQLSHTLKGGKCCHKVHN